MELEKTVLKSLHELAQSLGLKTGHYSIVVDKGHEYLYKGVETMVTIQGKKGDVTQTIYLKIRRPPTTSHVLKIPWANCFFNNVHYHTVVLPILKSYGHVPMTPTLYGSSLMSGEEFLILEDLERSEGYQKVKPHQGLNGQQIKEAIKMLAHFHCTVKLWKTKDLNQFKSTCSQFRPVLGPKYPYPGEVGKFEKIMKEMFKGIWELMRKPDEYRGTFSKIAENAEKLGSQALTDGSEVEDQPWTTLVNCCTYTTNFVFKFHTQTGSVIDVGLEDWSATRLGSPALDLSLLLFSSPSTGIFPETISLVNEYFTDHLSPAELKENHLPRYGIFGVLGGLLINVAIAIEDKLDADLRMDQITYRTFSESLSSTSIPDVKERLVAIVKAGVANKIL